MNRSLGTRFLVWLSGLKGASLLLVASLTWEGTGLLPGLVGADCNGNGQEDRLDIEDGSSQDCNGNGIPDSCDLSPTVRFEQARWIPGGETNVSIVQEDMDGNGYFDLVTADEQAANVWIHFAESEGIFSSSVKLPMGSEPQSVIVEDFNSDEIPDVATVNRGSYDITVRLGQGDGSFQSVLSTKAVEDPLSLSDLSAGDFDGDGIVDVAVTETFSGNVFVLLGTGEGTFRAPTRYNAGNETRALAIADIDGDGLLDILAANEGSDDVSVFLGEDQGKFQFEERLGVHGHPRDILARDLDRDGWVDIATANWNTATVTVRRIRGGGPFNIPVKMVAKGAPYAIAADDFDGDGVLDLVTANHNSADISLFLGNGDLTFQPARHFSTGYSGWSLTTGNFGGDSMIDIGVALRGVPQVCLVTGIESGLVQAPENFAVGSDPVEVVAGDLNNDGYLDLASAGGHSVSVLLGGDDGRFQKPPQPPEVLFQTALALADFDRNGTLDLAVTTRNTESISEAEGYVAILLGDGQGEFRLDGEYSVGRAPLGLLCADFNRDEISDIVTTNTGQPHERIVLLLGNGDSTFRDGGRLTAGGGTTSLSAADLDGDGIADLATVSEDDDEISVYLCKGDGSFHAPHSFPAGDEPQALTAADLNQDGRMDLIAGQHNGHIHFFYGRGDGFFSPAGFYRAGREPITSLQAVDIDRDGILDIVLSFFALIGQDEDLAILRGAGGAKFLDPLYLVSGHCPSSVIVEDFDRNSWLDIVSANYCGDDLTLLWNRTSPAASSDCNGNSVPDVCDIESGDTRDQDANGIPDVCQLGLQVPGDCNQDGVLDIADGICVFHAFFLTNPPDLPCESSGESGTGRMGLLDGNEDGQLDVSDIVFIIRFLFLGGPSLPQAVDGKETEGCVQIEACPDSQGCTSE